MSRARQGEAVAFNNRKLWVVCCKSGEIHGLSHLCCRFGWIIVDAGSEVFDGQDFMLLWAWKKRVCESYDVKPLVPRKTKQPVVQVESIDINNCLFLHLFKRQGLDSRPALHRIAKAQRSVSNPSRGSSSIVSDFGAWRKGAKFWVPSAPPPVTSRSKRTVFVRLLLEVTVSRGGGSVARAFETKALLFDILVFHKQEITR